MDLDLDFFVGSIYQNGFHKNGFMYERTTDVCSTTVTLLTKQS